MSDFKTELKYIDKFKLSQKLLTFVYDRLCESGAYQTPKQTDLATEIDVTPSMISSVKKARKAFSLESYENYARKIGMDFGEFTTALFRVDVSPDLEEKMTDTSKSVQISRIKEIDDHVKSIQKQGNINADFSGIMHAVAQILEVVQGAIFLKKPNTKRFFSVASLKPQVWKSKDHYYRIGEGVTGWILKHLKVVRVVNLQDQQELNQLHETDPPKWAGKSCRVNSAVDRKGYAYLGVPIFKDEQLFGVIRVVDIDNDRHFTLADETVLVHVANSIAELLHSGSPDQLENTLNRLQSDNEPLQIDEEAQEHYQPYAYLGQEVG